MYKSNILFQTTKNPVDSVNFKAPIFMDLCCKTKCMGNVLLKLIYGSLNKIYSSLGS